MFLKILIYIWAVYEYTLYSKQYLLDLLKMYQKIGHNNIPNNDIITKESQIYIITQFIQNNVKNYTSYIVNT